MASQSCPLPCIYGVSFQASNPVHLASCLPPSTKPPLPPQHGQPLHYEFKTHRHNQSPIPPAPPCSASGQLRTRPAVRSGSIIVSFTWCSGLSLSQEQLLPLRSMARRPASQVLQTIKDMVPKWIGGTCLSGLIEHGAVVTVQVRWMSRLPIWWRWWWWRVRHW